MGGRTMNWMWSGKAALLGILLLLSPVRGECQGWSKVADGILTGRFAPQGSPAGEDPMVVLRIDPSKHRFRLLSALEQGGKTRTTRGWCEEFGLIAAINAGMYKKDLQNAGYMKEYGFMNNPHVNAAFGAFMLFNPKDPSFPKVGMVDSRTDKDWRSVLEKYHSAIQSYRMISGGKKVRWPEQDKANSIAAAGMDEEGHVLFIHGRKPSTPRDFIDLLLSLPIHIRDAMYLEGGDETSMCVRVDGKWAEWTGLSNIEIIRSLQLTPSIPNVLGVLTPVS
jgi:uncharacterized protein YigE (DUF2233 family)